MQYRVNRMARLARQDDEARGFEVAVAS
jgi:hypothetical protein